MSNLVFGRVEAHRFPFGKDDDPFTGSATAQAWVCHPTTGARQYLQADLTSLSATPHDFACTVADSVAEVKLAATEAMVGRVFTVECTTDDPDFGPSSLFYAVVSESSSDPAGSSADIEPQGSFPPAP